MIGLVQLPLNPQAEYVLDWFHVTMHLTVLGQLAKGIALRTESKDKKKMHNVRSVGKKCKRGMHVGKITT